jgi:uncharacterized GH25 family protein
MKYFLAKLTLTILFSLISITSSAHELWLEPEAFITQPNSKLNAHIKVGQKFNGDQFPYLRSETKNLKLFLDRKLIALTPREGDYPAIQSILKQAGLHVLSYESTPEKVDYKNFDTFKTFLQEEGIWNKWSQKNPDFINTDIKENYTRYAKSLIQVGAKPGEDFNTGLLFELIALNTPYTNTDKIEILLLYNGKPHPNSQITIFHKNKDQTSISKTKTNIHGKATISFEKTGRYLLSSVYLEKKKSDKADWQSLWASLTLQKQ